MDMGWVHLALAITAMASGAWALSRPKGGLGHRRRGWLFVGSMIGVNVTALWIYDLTGSFNTFHVMAIISLATVLAGVGQVRFRRPRPSWRDAHAHLMAWSYVGLLAAAAAEAMARIPESWFWWMVVAASGVVFGAGWGLITWRMPQTLSRVQRS